MLHCVLATVSHGSLRHFSVCCVEFLWCYCCSLLIGSPRSVTDKLQRVLNAAACVITNSSKYDSRLSRTLHHDLHWLDVTERIQFESLAYNCIPASALHGPRIPGWTVCHHCVSKSSWWASVRHNQQPGHTTLQTVNLRQAPLPLVSLVQSAGTPDYFKSSDLSFNCFRQQLKTFFFCKYWHQSHHYFRALEMLIRSTNAWYLLTYLLQYIVAVLWTNIHVVSCDSHNLGGFWGCKI